MNNGHSSRLIYDECAYIDRTKERTDPLAYRLSPHSRNNCGQCLSTLGPRSGFMGQGVSTPVGHPVATAQYLTDVESILSNRNVLTNKCKNGEMNPIDVTKMGVKHLRTCNSYLDPMASRLSYPPFNIREAPIDRFYNLPQNPQEPIFYDFAANTKLEAKDNFEYELSKIKTTDPTNPSECTKDGECGKPQRYAFRPPYA